MEEQKRPTAESVLQQGEPAVMRGPLRPPLLQTEEVHGFIVWLVSVIRSPLTTIPGIILMIAATKEMWADPDTLMHIDFLTSNAMAKLSAGFGLINAAAIKTKIAG